MAGLAYGPGASREVVAEHARAMAAQPPGVVHGDFSACDAFDVIGQRVRVNFNGSGRQDFAEEDFEIRIRNRKTEPVQVRVVEHLYRWSNWSLTQRSHEYVKRDAQTIEFNLPVPPDAERVITYRVRYEWR